MDSARYVHVCGLCNNNKQRKKGYQLERDPWEGVRGGQLRMAKGGKGEGKGI